MSPSVQLTSRALKVNEVHLIWVVEEEGLKLDYIGTHYRAADSATTMKKKHTKKTWETVLSLAPQAFSISIRASGLMLEINEFRCFEAKKKRKVKKLAVAGSQTQGHLWLELPVLSHNSRTTTSPHNPLYVLYKWYWMPQSHTWQPLCMCHHGTYWVAARSRTGHQPPLEHLLIWPCTTSSTSWNLSLMWLTFAVLDAKAIIPSDVTVFQHPGHARNELPDHIR